MVGGRKKVNSVIENKLTLSAFLSKLNVWSEVSQEKRDFRGYLAAESADFSQCKIG